MQLHQLILSGAGLLLLPWMDTMDGYKGMQNVCRLLCLPLVLLLGSSISSLWLMNILLAARKSQLQFAYLLASADNDFFGARQPAIYAEIHSTGGGNAEGRV